MKNIIEDMFCYKKDTYFVYYLLMTDIDIDDIVVMVVLTNFSIVVTDYSKKSGAKIQFCVLTSFSLDIISTFLKLRIRENYQVVLQWDYRMQLKDYFF